MQKHFLPYDNVKDMVKNRLCRYLQTISEKNKEHSRQQKYPHRMGPVNFARVRAALREANGANEEPKRFEVFIATRTNQKRKELDEAMKHAIVRLISFYLYYAIRELTLIYTYTVVSDQDVFESRQTSGETQEEAFQSLFVKEQPRRVRCYGRSITQTDLRKHAEVSAIKQQHQQKVSTLQSRLGDMQTKQQQQAEEIHGLWKMVKLLLLHLKQK
ncbi:hypothetical protein PIB30_072844 [Stylosanthes scabra]|uniref:Uncharacterized protein n=1 Tax=Stylosanthes scabra TaxID=79078 RepID=A0ABU6TPP6_9FABA|nr:hypothetical protein [Stylosanthes scabra]